MESVSDELERSVYMLRECVRISEGQFTLPGEFCNVVITLYVSCAQISVCCFIVYTVRVYFLYDSIINNNRIKLGSEQCAFTQCT